MPPKRKVSFDPETAKTAAKKIKEQSVTIQKIEEAAQEFLGTIIDIDFDGLSNFPCVSTVELILVGTLGLGGVYRLNLANKLVPNNFPERLQVITSLLNYTLPPQKHLSSKQCGNVLNSMNRINISIVESELLSSFTLNTGQPTTFLTPPVSTCIIKSCRFYGVDRCLLQHHDSVTITVYTLNGPTPGIKQALKCKGCSCIYNYSKYGNKSSGGEFYYEQQRELIEVTHLVYCDRRLHEMYCFLR